MTQKPGDDDVIGLAPDDDDTPSDPGKAGAFKAITETPKAPKPAAAAPAAKAAEPSDKAKSDKAKDEKPADPTAQVAEIDEAIRDANILVANGDLKGAITHLQTLASDKKKDKSVRAKAWAEISKICLTGKDIKNAELAADKAIGLDPKNIQPWKDVAKAKPQDRQLYLIGKAQTAKKDNPEASKALYTYLGQSAERSAASAEGDKKKDYLVSALRYYFFADDLKSMNRLVEAVLKIESENSSALAVSAYLNQDNFNERQKYLDHAKKADPKNGFVSAVERHMQEQSAAALGVVFSQEVVAEGVVPTAVDTAEYDPETGMRIMSASAAAAVTGKSGGWLGWLKGVFGGSSGGSKPAAAAPLPTPAADLKAAAENGAPPAKAAKPDSNAPIPLADGPNTPAAG